MSIKILPTLIISTIIFCCCQKEEPNKDYVGIWPPLLSGQRSENSVLLNWKKPMAYPANIIPPNYATPDFAEIYISKSVDTDFEKIKTVKGNISSTTIKNLKNNEPYYFYVILHKRGFDTLSSKKIMVVPSNEKEANLIYTGKRYALSLGDSKNSISEIAFTNWNFKWEKDGTDYNTDAIIIYSTNESQTTVIDTFSNSPSWSPDGNSLMYITHKKEIAQEGHRPSHIVIYDIQKNTFRHFSDENNEIRYPIWKNGEESVVYIKNPIDSGFEIWEMEIQTETKYKLVSNNPFSDNTLLNPDKPDLSPDGENLFFEAAQSSDLGASLSIWKFSFQKKSIEPVFPTEWDNSNPAISPDSEKLAFISNRSGNENIWLYNLKSHEFSQITGTKDFYIRRGLGKISWADNQTLLFCGNIGELEGILTIPAN